MLDENKYSVVKKLIIDSLNADSKLDLTDFTDNITLLNYDIDSSDRLKLIQDIQDDIEYKRRYDHVMVKDPTVVRDRRNHNEWYGEWLKTNNNNAEHRYNWTRMKKILKTKLSKVYDTETTIKIIKNIDNATDHILSDMEAPTRPVFDNKGLVIGYVQSGKTANFSALISKAADAGYRLIVVLTGIHENLRRQTQVRLDQELTGVNETNQSNDEYVDYPAELRKWIRLTSAPDYNKTRSTGEFKKQGRNPFDYEINGPQPALAVIKKNTTVMKSLIEWINDSATDDLKNSLPFLLIDDEADLASINTKVNATQPDISETNRRIRELLSIFKKKCYVAYTATPFANFFIDVNTPDDLYPRNFIRSLPLPDGYFGSSQIFDSPINNYFLRDIIRPIIDHIESQDDINQLLGQGEYAVPEIPDTLMESILTFIVSCAIRCLRGDENKAMSMLIHVSWKIIDQETVYKEVDKYFKLIKKSMASKNRITYLSNEFEHVYDRFQSDSQQILSYLKLDYTLPDFESVLNEIKKLILTDSNKNGIRVLQLNSKSEHELDYTNAVKPKVIAIGGNVLSRGLTLEGLVTSYYARASLQFDTLLQMGRWFGYRAGYEDLTRVWATPQIQRDYQHLALVEEEVRSSLSVYEEEDLTPADIPVLVRDHIRLNVTAKNKLGGAVNRQTSFSGSSSQILKLPLDKLTLLKQNIDLSGDFISYLNDNYQSDIQCKPNYIFQEIDARIIMDEFLSKFKVYDCGFAFRELMAYLERVIDYGECLKWSVGVKSLQRGSLGSEQWGGLEVKLLKRTKKYDKLKTGEHHIGVLTEPEDKFMDLEESRKDLQARPDNAPPMLIFYRISANSGDERATQKLLDENKEPGRIELWREVSGKKINPMGLAIFTPISENEPNNFIGQNFS